MKHAWSPQFEAVRVVQLIKIDGFGSSLYEQSDYYVKSTWNVDGYDWEVRLYPSHVNILREKYVLLKLIFLGEAHGQGSEIEVTANISCRLVDPSGVLKPSAEKISAMTS